MSHMPTQLPRNNRIPGPVPRKQRILDALHQVITEKGINGIHLVQVAQKAGSTRGELIRQFGSVANLLSNYVQWGYFIPMPPNEQVSQVTQLQDDRAANVWYRLSQQLMRYWRANKASREVLRFSPSVSSKKVAVIEQSKQECFTRFASQLMQAGPMLGGDEQACLAIILGGLNFLTIQAHENQPFLGIDLRSDDGWLRIEKALALLYARLELSETHDPD